jgi:hypothetical protein
MSTPSRYREARRQLYVLASFALGNLLLWANYVFELGVFKQDPLGSVLAGVVATAVVALYLILRPPARPPAGVSLDKADERPTRQPREGGAAPAADAKRGVAADGTAGALWVARLGVRARLSGIARSA